MKAITKEKFKMLTEANGWSHDHARGYVDGEAFRKQGRKPLKYVLVGIDEYCLGFRAGYYERRDAASSPRRPSDIPARRG